MKIGDLNIQDINPIPEIETGDEKEVYAFYGLAAFHAQCAEKALVNFVMAYRLLDNKVLDQEQWLELYAGINSKTFGRLLGQIKTRVELSDHLLAHLDHTLTKRNWLAHDFYYDRANHFLDLDGRIAMIKELQELIELFQVSDRAIEQLSLKVWSHFGVTEEWIEKEMAIQHEEYLSGKNA